MIKYAANAENMQVIHTIIDRLISNVKGEETVKIEFEMAIKVFLNLMYLLLKELPPSELEAYHKGNTILI